MGVGWWRENAIQIEFHENVIMFCSPYGCGSITLLNGCSSLEYHAHGGKPIDEDIFILPEIVEPYSTTFDAKAVKVLPPHLRHDLSFELTVDFVKINCLFNPLTEQKDAVLAT